MTITTPAPRTSTIRPSDRPRLMSRKQFDEWASQADLRPTIARPWNVIECTCGDLNCHGWRFVTGRDTERLAR